MSREYEFEDAANPLTINVTWEDINGARPGSSRDCVMARAIKREYGCMRIEIYRTRAYIWFHPNKPPKRYQITQSARDLLVAFDAAGRSHPINVTFRPPRHAVSLKRLRSEDFKKKRKESYARQKARGNRRAYTNPDPLTLWGVRNGQGKQPGASGNL